MTLLQNKRIVITRPPHQANTFAAQLRQLGAEPILLPTIAIHPLENPAELDNALQRGYDWVIFTSANAIEQVWHRFEALEISPRLPPKIGVVGTATAELLIRYGFSPAVIPSKHTAEGLLAALAGYENVQGQHCFLPMGNLARPYLAEQLRLAGAQVTPVIAYQTVKPALDSTLLNMPFDAVTFTSPSTVHNFMALFEHPLEMLQSAQVVCIGPVTAAAAYAEGLPVHATAEPHTQAGLIATLCALF